MRDMTLSSGPAALSSTKCRRAILDTAAAMLAEMTVAEVTLNELSRRVGHLGELSDHDAPRLAAATMVTASALWPQCQPSAAMLTAYEADPGLAALRLDFEPALREFLEVFISGILARAADG